MSPVKEAEAGSMINEPLPVNPAVEGAASLVNVNEPLMAVEPA